MSNDAAGWAERNWWDAAGDHFSSTDHDETAAYAYTAAETLGPFALGHPPDDADIWNSARPSLNGQVLIGYVKLGVATRGETVRAWPDQRDVWWWDGAKRFVHRAHELFVHDPNGDTEPYGRWFPLGGDESMEAARAHAQRLSRLTGDTVLWGRTLGAVDMH